MQLTKTRTVLESKDQFRKRKNDFLSRNYTYLRDFLSEDLKIWVADKLKNTNFYHREHNIGAEDCARPNTLSGGLNLFFNCEELISYIRELSNCDEIRGFEGRIYRLAKADKHYDDWHNDCVDGRKLALSLNIGQTDYIGGDLKLKNIQSNQIDVLSNHNFGDAILFCINSSLTHRIDPVVSGEKIAFAGWFTDRPSYLVRTHN